MTLRAKSLLIEEYPLSEKFIETKNDNCYIFDGWVTSFHGIGRFVIGLIAEFKNIQNTDFIKFIKEKQKYFKIFSDLSLCGIYVFYICQNVFVKFDNIVIEKY